MFKQARWDEFWQVWYGETCREAAARRSFEGRWRIAKAKLAEAFGGLALVEEIDAVLTADEVRSTVNEWMAKALVGLSHTLIGELDYLLLAWFNELTPDELREGRWLVGGRRYFAGRSDLDVDSLSPRPQEGAKLGKVLRAYLKAFAGDLLDSRQIEWWVQQFSELLGRLRPQSATVVVSLDPLDFLLASESTTGWTSCHSLAGCHRAGNLSYLMDSVTAIAYAFIERHEWRGITLPRKIWRQWVFIDPDCGIAYFQKQYPTEREELSRTARRLVGEALARYLNVPEKWTVRRNKPYNDIRRIVDLLYLDPTSTAIRLNAVEDVEPRIMHVGEAVPCPACWEERITNPDLLTCNSCNGMAECVGCRHWYNVNEMYEFNGDLYCDDCCDERFIHCACCGTLVDRNEALFGTDNDLYCEWCWNEYFISCSICNEAVLKEDAIETEDNAYCRECFEDTLVYCDNCDRVVWKEDAAYTGGHAYCQDCVAACVECDRVFVKAELDADGLCEDCAAIEKQEAV